MSRVSLLSTILAAALCVPATAQTSKALISGIVTDSSGAAITNAKVTITDTARNQDFRTETNSSGVYRVIELTPSTYRVTAEAPGFRTYVLESLRLSTQQNATLNISLEIGAITEKVEITATGPLLEASSAALSAVVENKKIIELPLNNRNIYTLLTLVPGITPSTPNNAESDFFTSTIRFSINGGKESVNDIQLDGVSAMVRRDWLRDCRRDSPRLPPRWLRDGPRWSAIVRDSLCGSQGSPTRGVATRTLGLFAR